MNCECAGFMANLVERSDPDFHQLEPDVELAKPAPRAPWSRIVKRGESTRRPPRTTPSVIVLPMRTSEISRLSTDTSQTLVPLAETMMSLEAGLALELPEESPLWLRT